MSDTPIKDRALRIHEISKVRRLWGRVHFPAMWRNHLTASHEFQLLDVLRDIRAVLTLILIVLAIGVWQKPRPQVVNVDQGQPETAMFTDGEG